MPESKVHVDATIPEAEFEQTQPRVGHLKRADSNKGPKDNGTRPTVMPEQPHVGNLPKRESNPGRDSGGAVPAPIEAHGPTKGRG